MVLCPVQELVWILHKSLEASQLEKRSCAEFLAEEGEQERLELLRHRERQAADLRDRLEEAKTEVEEKKSSLAQRDAQLAELQENIRMLKEKNEAKQEVRSHLRTGELQTPGGEGCWFCVRYCDASHSDRFTLLLTSQDRDRKHNN